MPKTMWHQPKDNPPLKVAVMTLAYNEEEFIGAVVDNWRGKVHKHVVFLSTVPWHGQSLPTDQTEDIARSKGAEVVKGAWASETSQRNYALGYLREYDYVLIVDADELYTESDQIKILESLATKADEEFVDNVNCYRASNVKTYFKSPEFALSPPDSHEPLIAIDPKRATFKEHRVPTQPYEIPLDVTMHHVSYLRNDIRLFHKFKQFEHYDQVKKDWYTAVWSRWTEDMDDVRAYGGEKSKAVRNPMPEEIRRLIYGGRLAAEQEYGGLH